MKRAMLLLLLEMMSWPVAALAGEGAYIQGIWTSGNPVYISQGATFTTNRLDYDQTFTNVALLYHPLSAGSLIPASLQPFIPPESWGCTIGGGYAPSTGRAGVVGFGCGLNLLDSVRAWSSELLQKAHSATLANLGKQIAPGVGPINLYAGRQENISIGGKFVPRWFFGAAMAFK